MTCVFCWLLQCLSLGINGVEMILRGEFQRNLLHNIKVLVLCFRSDSDTDVCMYEILKQVPDIEKLVMCDGSLKEIFCSQIPNNVDYSGLLIQPKELRLENFGELVSIGLENSWTDSFVRTLETFEVIRCSSLQHMVACKVSFSNLTYLKVERCDCLSYLFTSLTAKSLLQLKTMVIQQCKSIEEIVFKEEDEADDDDKIIFPQLNCLDIAYLENLRWFYRGSLCFPSLEEHSVRNCGKMLTLCPGAIETDKLSQVILDFLHPFHWKLISTLPCGTNFSDGYVLNTSGFNICYDFCAYNKKITRMIFSF